MTTKKIILVLVAALATVLLGYVVYFTTFLQIVASWAPEKPGEKTTLSGTYECLQYIGTADAGSQDCIFGFKADDGAYYVANFGKDTAALSQFKRGVRVRVEGSIIERSASSTKSLLINEIQGMFNITKTIEGI